MRRPYGVIFDLGETILRQISLNFITGNARLLEFARETPNLTAEEIQDVANELNYEVDKLREESMIEFRVQWFQKLIFEMLDIHFTIDYPEMEREFWNAAVKYKPAEGIMDILDILEANGVKTGILSNTAFSGAVLEEELGKHNLAHRFSFLIASADYGFRKPHGRIFQIAAKKMNLQPDDIWFVGDKLEYDIKGAIDSGLYPVWYNPQNKPNDSDYPCLEIRSWDELKDKIESF